MQEIFIADDKYNITIGSTIGELIPTKIYRFRAHNLLYGFKGLFGIIMYINIHIYSLLICIYF